MRRRLLAPLLAAMFGSVHASPSVQPATVRLCTEDGESFPWLLADREEGLNFLMLKQVEQRLGIRFEVVREPWRRCLRSLQQGSVDGLIKISHSEERARFARYPMRDGQLDLRRRMLDDSYHLYRLRGSTVSWDGRSLAPAGVLVGAQSGCSIVAQLRQVGARVDEGTRLADGVLAKLALRRTEAATLQTQQAEHVLAQRPDLAAVVERVEPALVVKPYFLVFAPGFLEEQEALGEAIWHAIGQVRESSAYRRQLQSFKP